MLFASFSFLLRFYTLTKMGAWRLVLKRGRPPFFSLLRIRALTRPRRAQGYYSYVGRAGGNYSMGALWKRGNRGVKFT